MGQKKLCRNGDNKIIAGVCSGIGDYLNVDYSIVRILWAFVSMCGGAGLLLYIICAIVIPEKTNTFETTDYEVKETKDDEK